MTDTWNEIQEVKIKQSKLREKMAERRRQREDLAAELSRPSNTSDTPESLRTATPPADIQPVKLCPDVEAPLMRLLGNIDPHLPCNAASLATQLSKSFGSEVRTHDVELCLDKLSSQSIVSLSKSTIASTTETVLSSVDQAKLKVLCPELVLQNNLVDDSKRKTESNTSSSEEPQNKVVKLEDPSLESLLSMPSAKERENKKLNDQILQLLTKQTTKEQSLIERFRSQGGLQEFCPCGTKGECFKANGHIDCKKLHFKKIIKAHTDESLGDCSFLNTCFHMDNCKYVHYKIESPEKKTEDSNKKNLTLKTISDPDASLTMFPPQWIQCDLRHLDMTILGKCGVVMADPPWDIHMELPYGTMGDDEMRKLDVPSLQDDGFLFLWVTGRAMELGRECMVCWGYKRIEELIWVKTNQLQRLIRTGRTGHWINHGKEHCLVGVKGNPKGVNRGLDCDIIVAEVRATSHKPDEIYGIIERLSPGTRKVELFGRPHNVQPNWITLGNQVEGVKLLDPDIVNRFRERYPDGNCMDPPKKT